MRERSTEWDLSYLSPRKLITSYILHLFWNKLHFEILYWNDCDSGIDRADVFWKANIINDTDKIH